MLLTNVRNTLIKCGFKSSSYGNCLVYSGKNIAFMWFSGQPNFKIVRVVDNHGGIDWVDLVTGENLVG